MIHILNYHEAERRETPHGVDVRPLFDSEQVQVVEIMLGPGESLKKHITYVDVVFYVLEGTGFVEIGDEEALVSADMLIESPRGVPHRLRNESGGPFRFLVIKAPRPTKTSRIL